MKRVFVDQMNRTVCLDKVPKRIVSIVPSQTELLYDLGIGDKVVGITKFCIHPEEWFSSKKRIGGTKKLSIEAIQKLNPDLIIGNKEENSIDDILQLEKIAPVWMSDIFTIDDGLEMIKQIGLMLDCSMIADKLVNEIKIGFESIQKIPVPLSYLYFIWKDPDFLAGTNTFIDSMLESVGFVNQCRNERYPEWTTEMGDPAIVFLSSEPYPFKEEHIELFKRRFPQSKISLIDGEMCSWYGSRMLKAIPYLENLRRRIAITD